MKDYRNDKIDTKFYETMPSRLLVRSVREHADALCTIVEGRLEEPNPDVPQGAQMRAWGHGLVLGCFVSSGFWVVFIVLYVAARRVFCGW